MLRHTAHRLWPRCRRGPLDEALWKGPRLSSRGAPRTEAMRLIIQRITRGEIVVGGQVIGRTGQGLCPFLGVAKEDSDRDVEYLAQKTVELRIFEDENGKFNRSLHDVHGEILVVSEFTLYGDCSKGRRPSFSRAAPPEEAARLYRRFVEKLQERGIKVATGKFQAHMEVSTINDGPVTFILDSK